MPGMIVTGKQSSEYGTPTEILHSIREAHGSRIAIDLASSERWADHVGAREWVGDISRLSCEFKGGRGDLVFCNPPAGVEAVKAFWQVWASTVIKTPLGQGAFVIYQIDHWRALEKLWLDLWVYIPRRRLRYVGAPAQAHFSSAIASTRRLTGEWIGVETRWLWR